MIVDMLRIHVSWKGKLVISLAVMMVSLIAIGVCGFRFSADIRGGVIYEFRLPKGKTSSPEELKGFLQKVVAVTSVKQSGPDQYIVELPASEKGKRLQMDDKITEVLAKPSMFRYEETEGEYGTAFLIQLAAVSGVLMLLLAIYISIRFGGISFGISGATATIHDVLLVVAVSSILSRLFGVEITTWYLPAILGVAAFSLYDTLVVFDRIRTHQKGDRKASFEVICDRALKSTFVRSLRTSLVMLLVFLCVILFGPLTLHCFAGLLMVGVLLGMYSSGGVAVPAVLLAAQIGNKIPRPKLPLFARKNSH